MPWLYLADQGMHVTAGFFRVPDLVWEEMSLVRIAKLFVTVGVSTFFDHTLLRKRCVTVSVIRLYQGKDNEPFVLPLRRQIPAGRNAVREFR
jgi:hypothetical protein